MSTVTFFVVAQILASGYACWRGGAPERLAALALLIAMCATASVPHSHFISYHSIYWDVVRVDLALFVWLTAVALIADRFWPMTIAALQLVALMAHGVKGYDHAVVAVAYWLVVGKTAYLMLAVLAIGTSRHHHRRRQGFPEYAWSFKRHADYAAKCR